MFGGVMLMLANTQVWRMKHRISYKRDSGTSGQRLSNEALLLSNKRKEGSDVGSPWVASRPPRI